MTNVSSVRSVIQSGATIGLWRFIRHMESITGESAIAYIEAEIRNLGSNLDQDGQSDLACILSNDQLFQAEVEKMFHD